MKVETFKNLHLSRDLSGAARVRARLRNAGLALIELMVALTIGMVLTLGILILMSSTSRSYKISDEFARMQESGSSGIRYLADDIRMAGFYGMVASQDAVNVYDTNVDGFIDYAQDAGINFGLSAAADCGIANWSLQTVVPIWGLPPGTTAAQANAALPCIPATNYVTGPAIVLRGAVGTMINRIVAGANAGQPQNWSTAQLDANTVYVQSDPGTGYVFQGVNYDNYKTANYGRQVPTNAGIVDAPIYVYQSHIYYIRPCSRPTGGADAWGNPTCLASDDGNRPIPTLARQELQSVAGGPQLREVGLVEGVEQMSIFYGLDSMNSLGTPIPLDCTIPSQCGGGPDGIADTYTAIPPNVGTPGKDAWAQVVMVRLNLLVRASAPTAGYDDSSKSYDLGGGNIWNCLAVGAPCNYKRHMFSQQIQLRNVAGRRQS